MIETASFGEWMAQRRKSLDLTQRELAMRTNCALATVKKIEIDERRPSRELAQAFAEALQIPAGVHQVFVECARGLRPVDALAAVTAESVQAARRTPAVDSLPSSTTAFIPRPETLSQITRMLDRTDCRLLTLVGVGGAGKTRLALEIAQAQRERFADGTVFVPLAAVTDAAFIAPAIAHSLNLVLSGSSEAQLLAYLRDKTLLVVLDNCEQLVEGIGWLSVLLANAPRVKLLTTSRERLQLAEEWVYTVPMLDDSEAVDLFVQTAHRLNAHFESHEQEGPISAICQLVENLPLAIELAASWTPFMSCAQIAENIQRDIDFLTASVRNIPERHRSIRAVFDHSWRLLSPVEQEIMMRLSVFRGGWTVEEAEPIAGATLLTLRGLMEKSLVRPAGPGRHDMHELIRQYAADQLETTGQSTLVQRVHAEIYLKLADRLDLQVYGPMGISAFARFDQEHDNLRAVMSRALHAGEIETVRRYVDILWSFWLRRGHWSEGRYWAKTAVDHSESEEDNPLLCRTLILASIFTSLQGSYGEAHKYALRWSEMARRLKDPETLMRALAVEGQALPDLDPAAEAFDQFIQIAEQTPTFARGATIRTVALANVHSLYGDRLRAVGRLMDAENHYRESLHLFRQLGNVDNVTYPIGNLGRLALLAGRTKEANDLIAESVALSQAIGNRVGIADWLFQLGNVALAQDELLQADACFQEVRELYEEIGNQRGYADVLAALAFIALIKGNLDEARANLDDVHSRYFQFFSEMKSIAGHYSGWFTPELVLSLQLRALLETADKHSERAATIFGATDAIQKQKGYKVEPRLRVRIDAALSSIRVELAEDIFAVAWNMGQGMSLIQILEYALEKQ